LSFELQLAEQFRKEAKKITTTHRTIAIKESKNEVNQEQEELLKKSA
jgi:hypothetical protein